MKERIKQNRSNSLKKYWRIICITFKEQIEYKFDVIAGAFMAIFKIALAYFLWKAIFGTKTMIGNYTFPMMITYYILTSFFMKLNQSESVLWQFSAEIAKGYFSKYIIQPINPVNFFISKCVSKSIFILFINCLAFICWTIMFKNYFVVPVNFTILVYIIFFVISGLFIMMQINYLVATLAFKYVEIAGFYYISQNIIDFLSGAIIPLFLLPNTVINIVKFLPFYYTLYFPASIYLGENLNEIYPAIAVITCWNIGLYILNQLLYSRLIRFYEGVGS